MVLKALNLDLTQAPYRLLANIRKSSFLGLRRLVNLAWWDPTKVILPIDTLDYVVADSCKFIANSQIDSLQKVEGNPWFSKVKETDIVVDIGANIGAIAIPLAKRAKKVYAIEPLYYSELLENVYINELRDKIEVIKVGIGEKKTLETIIFGARKEICPIVTFQDLKGITGPIDFLKIDCEGAEWSIKPEELEGIREIRAEFHIRRKSKKQDVECYYRWVDWLEDNGYLVDLSKGLSPICVPFTDVYLLIASKQR